MLAALKWNLLLPGLPNSWLDSRSLSPSLSLEHRLIVCVFLFDPSQHSSLSRIPSQQSLWGYSQEAQNFTLAYKHVWNLTKMRRAFPLRNNLTCPSFHLIKAIFKRSKPINLQPLFWLPLAAPVSHSSPSESRILHNIRKLHAMLLGWWHLLRMN